MKRSSARPGWRFHAPNAPAEFGMSIADDWRDLGVGSALLQEIERKAAADGIEFLFGDTLRTNEGMIGLALGRGFRLGQGSNRASCELRSGWTTQLLTCRAGSGAKSPAARNGAWPDRETADVIFGRRVRANPYRR